ncbi:MAG TPA: UDP-N-acetylmuramoyl-tripeptide--D-alanyl-D-alanine ligase, partial [Chitinophagales bacterium]|nr:UDP-N-acetylmuramoyl-tripeptide--D-alanyl-D-alanine ligase [Chitinophagales bacterium]
MEAVNSIYHIFKTARQVSTDTRTIEKGDLFFALKGPNFNGNQYAEEALKKGALAAVIDEPLFRKDENYILVENTLKALQQLAHHHRRQLKIPVIAVAGSNGKTTTKELIRVVLQTTFETFATQGNLNNEIGVPLTLLKVTDNARMAVIEMGARQRGDIRLLCQIAEPTHGIITNTGKDHLETFKTLENTRKTNAELYKHLSKMNGTAFVNIADDDLLREASVVKKIITYGKKEEAVYYGKIESFHPLLSISYKTESGWNLLRSRLTGKYNFENIMAAVA